jgi:site-specific DNA-methyltransferase (adenine-specific)
VNPTIIKNCTLYNMDCMEYMKSLPDNAFDLAIVDPPYGIKRFENIKETKNRIENRFQSGIWNNNVPSKEYFDELMRISKNQIIWGGNYFDLPPTRCFIFWDKLIQVENFADGELAWTSFDRLAKKYQYAWGGLSDGVVGRNKKEKSIHPTQKPVKLYEWLLTNYAKQGDKILDTHLGSGSHAIACNNLGFELVGLELDSDYFKASCERIVRESQQERLF